MNVTKIKFKGKETEVHYFDEERLNEHSKSTLSIVKIKCADDRTPEFTEAANKALTEIMTLISLENAFEFCEAKELSEINIDDYVAKPVFNALIQIKLFDMTAKLKIKTPNILKANIGMRILVLVEHAKRFIAGERAN